VTDKEVDMVKCLIKIIKQADSEGFDISFEQIQKIRNIKTYIGDAIEENTIIY
jgi:hypothetical protein